MKSLNKEEIKKLKSIQSKLYMKPVLRRIRQRMAISGTPNVLDDLHDILKDVEADVMRVLKRRKRLGEINDISQASKSTVGAIFVNSIVYILYQLKNEGHLRDDIYTTTSLLQFKLAKIPRNQIWI